LFSEDTFVIGDMGQYIVEGKIPHSKKIRCCCYIIGKCSCGNKCSRILLPIQPYCKVNAHWVVSPSKSPICGSLWTSLDLLNHFERFWTFILDLFGWTFLDFLISIQPSQCAIAMQDRRRSSSKNPPTYYSSLEHTGRFTE
jgi:hypothetical protein